MGLFLVGILVGLFIGTGVAIVVVSLCVMAGRRTNAEMQDEAVARLVRRKQEATFSGASPESLVAR